MSDLDKEWLDRLKGLPIRAEIYDSTGNDVSMTISDCKMFNDDKLVFSNENKYELSSGALEDGNSQGSAVISMPVNGQSATYRLTGSGRVELKSKIQNFRLALPPNRLRRVSSNTHWISLKLKTQRSTGLDYFDLVIGPKGQPRDRARDPHISFRPDGSGKYIRSGSESIGLSTDGYMQEGGLLLPQKTAVSCNDFSIIINYNFRNNVLAINSIRFGS